MYKHTYRTILYIYTQSMLFVNIYIYTHIVCYLCVYIHTSKAHNEATYLEPFGRALLWCLRSSGFGLSVAATGRAQLGDRPNCIEPNTAVDDRNPA